MDAQQNMDPTVKVLDVCSFFVMKGIETNAPIKQLKLQKLLYFAQGVYMASSGGNHLFAEPLQAWQYGPVVPTVYHEYKLFGNNPITALGIDLYCEGGMEELNEKRSRIPGAIIEFLEKIWRAFGKYHDIQLVQLTHLNGSPWFQIYEKNNRTIPKTGIVIPPQQMFDYFKSSVKL